MSQHTNQLIKETSPYLLQHAHNPVDWHPWSEEAFEKAAKQDKPVLVSIGYAACHWCHVMERESFENEEVAQLMNENFINIKVDREERPDVDHIYMDAVQAISGSGGWPLNVFLTPDRKPFYGGTYFPPQQAFNRASWTDTLLFISKTYKERKNEVIAQAQTLIDHIQASNNFGTGLISKEIFQLSNIDAAFNQVMNVADKKWGGFGKAPKFPQTFTIHFLLQYAHTRKNEDAKKQALLSIDKMIAGGIYDQVGGGFSRYSTDNEWLAPHFEKMLYDNALLISTLSDAYMITGKSLYKDVISNTLAFIERELSHPSGGFYSALDADSEGVEGKFYVWDHSEVVQLLGEKAELFCSYYDITTSGNWEEKNIPRVLKPMDEFAKDAGYDLDEVKAIMEKGIQLLFQEREKRIRPQLDDKVILGWNALMNSAYCKAFAATAEMHYKGLAVKHMDFMLTQFISSNNLLHHTWKNGQARYPAFLDDYSYLITALLDLLQITADLRYLDKAKELTQLVIDHFGDTDTPYFFYTHKDQTDIPLRKKEMYDGAMPSGNSTMAFNLYRLSIYLDNASWRERSASMVGSIGTTVCKYPTSFGIWLSLLFEMIHGTSEVVLIGKNAENYLGKILGIFISHRLVLASQTTDPAYPLLADKAENDEILIYLCENYACKRPVSTIQDFVSLLNSN